MQDTLHAYVLDFIQQNVRKLEVVYTPDENGHPFRSKADSDSGVIRTLIPAQGGRIFRIAGIDIT